jgi:multicomponent K+:H+ antiporter subunit G
MTEYILPAWAAFLAGLVLICGGLLALLGASGFLRLQDFYQRIHPPTMGATLGTGCILISSMLVSSALQHRPVIHELVITVFVVITAPVSAITLMRAAISRTGTKSGTAD